MSTKSPVIILFLLVTASVQAANCDSFNSIKETKTMCWLESHKAWISESCLATNARCEALTFLKVQNLKFEKDIYRDKQNNETVFALFKDKSMLDMDTINELVE